MKKVRFLFIVLFLLIFLISLYLFNTFRSPMDAKIQKIDDFQITEISGAGNIYYAGNYIQNFTNAQPFELKTLNYSREIFIKSDSQTSFAFSVLGTYFSAMPDSHIYYEPKTKEFYLLKGEFFWKKEAAKSKAEIFVKDMRRASQQSINLSTLGRLRYRDNIVEIWNFDGKLTFLSDGNEEKMEKNKLLVFRRGSKPRILNILSSPGVISPENTILSLEKMGDSVVKFNWKHSLNANDYIFRLYSSSLRENVLHKDYLTTNRISLDLLRFNHGEFYWEIFPYDSIREIEGSPSNMGYVKLLGSVLDREKVLKPPKLTIKSITASGNVVVIKGEADTNSKLYINEIPKQIDQDGTFIHTITYKTIGSKTIVFRLVSPFEVETRIEEQVSIYEE